MRAILLCLALVLSGAAQADDLPLPDLPLPYMYFPLTEHGCPCDDPGVVARIKKTGRLCGCRVEEPNNIKALPRRLRVAEYVIRIYPNASCPCSDPAFSAELKKQRTLCGCTSEPMSAPYEIRPDRDRGNNAGMCCRPYSSSRGDLE